MSLRHPGLPVHDPVTPVPSSAPRYVDRYEEEGADGLVDKRLGQVSARRAPVDEVMRTEALYRERS